jgi:hypothetical protein
MSDFFKRAIADWRRLEPEVRAARLKKAKDRGVTIDEWKTD